jgi:hypothetical protein
MIVKAKRLFAVCFFCLAVASGVLAGDVEKAFKYLNTGDYANAKKYLDEAINDEKANVAANYGMAKFYSLRDNKLYNLDSANLYIKRAAAKLPLNPDDKQTKKFLTFGVRDYTVQALQQDINQSAYAVAEKENTVESYQYFIDNYTDKGLLNRSTEMRNQLAYIRARAKNDPKVLDDFIKKYPDADQVKEAKELYEKLLYEQTTADKSYQSYKAYLDQYPNGAYINDAKKNYDEKLIQYYNDKHDLKLYVEFAARYKEHPAYNSVQDSIYKLATKAATIDAFRNFVNTYTDNRNVRDAWMQLYTLYTAAGTEEIYRKFIDEFPGFPDKNKVYIDLQASNLDMKPFQQNGKWGYAVQPAKDSIAIVIPFEYDEAYSFNSGLAAVRSVPCDESKCTYFYIDKHNKRAFPLSFNYAGNFENGFAIVGVGACEVDSCKYGMIDKRGNWTIQPVYDELDDPTEGLYMASKDERYGFLDHDGQPVISLKYTNAMPFSEGVTAVAIDTNWFFIDKTGKQLFYDYFHDVSGFKDSLCAVSKDGDSWGYIDRSGSMVIPAIYESAEDFDAGFAIVSKKEKDLKHKGFFISQRYRIDKAGKVVEKLLAPKEKAPKKASKKKHSR